MYWEVLETFSRFSDSLGLIALSLEFSSQLEFIIVKEYRVKSAEGKDVWGEVQGIQEQASEVLSQWSHTGCAQSPRQWAVTAHVKCSLPGKLVKDLAPRVLLGADHVACLCLAHTQFQIPQRKAGAHHKPSCLQKRFRHREPFIPVWGWEPFPNAGSQMSGANLESRPFLRISNQAC